MSKSPYNRKKTLRAKSPFLPYLWLFSFCINVPKRVISVSKRNVVCNLPKEVTVSGFGIGKGHLPVMFSALANGCHVRVGMEDNVVYGYDKEGKKILANNLMLVERAARAVEAYGNEVATSAEAREMLGLAPLDHEAVVKALDALTIEDLEKAKAEASEKYGTTYFAAKSMG